MKRKIVALTTILLMISLITGEMTCFNRIAYASSMPDAFTASASSYYTQNRTPVDPSCAIDGDVYSSWDSYGEYENAWFQLTAKNGKVAIDGLRIMNGKCKSSSYGDTYYYKNARIKRFTLIVDGVYQFSRELKDTKEWQYVYFGKTVIGTRFKLQIEEVYQGSGTPLSNFGVCITEIELLSAKATPTPKTTSTSSSASISTPTPTVSPNVKITTVPGQTLNATKAIDSGSAITYLEQYKDILGYKDISEFSDPEYSSNGIISAYSFHQFVEGIPVEGGEVRFITGSDNELIYIINNYVELSNLVRGNVSIDTARSALPFENDSTAYISFGRVICVPPDGSAYECYKFLLQRYPGTVYYVSTYSGEIVMSYDSVYEITYAGTGNSLRKQDKGKTLTVNAVFRDGMYFLEDYG